jgi:hypothetical protein
VSRYYLFEMPTPADRAAGDRPHIRAEIAVLNEDAEEADRPGSHWGRGDIADICAIAGNRTLISTRDELLALKDGRRALRAWKAQDDIAFQAEWARRRKATDEENARFAALSEPERDAAVRAVFGWTQEELDELRVNNRPRLRVVNWD